jgi:hypothetical protein
MIESNLMVGDRVWYRPKSQTGNDFVQGRDLDEFKIYAALVAGIIEYDPPVVNLTVFNHVGRSMPVEKVKLVSAVNCTASSHTCTADFTQRQLREANS